VPTAAKNPVFEPAPSYSDEEIVQKVGPPTTEIGSWASVPSAANANATTAAVALTRILLILTFLSGVGSGIAAGQARLRKPFRRQDRRSGVRAEPNSLGLRDYVDPRSCGAPPEIVEGIARFLAGRVVEVEEVLAGSDAEEPERLRVELL